ncbi:MAG: UDP-N-acetylmuramoyl-tripeptide--D-alanyl-D-alanine ligase [Proteobacteria bacterium]|jgi:UDP-N-acetylmuramoyl-tripeptide--D-alanyl-D-alanine ligase|nr:UDP-N-acetylmuramoyl-tripeptide--D-alanyl-D-alanine ligase [Pseudomonadota bacterium]
MKKMTLDFVLNAVQGQLLSQSQTEFKGVGSDTRKDLNGQIFIALKGDNFDAHAFLDKAKEQGAAALIVHDSAKVTEELKSQLTVILVKDTLRALHDLARAQRRRSSALVLGITGSNGKTTSKEFTAILFSQYRKTHYSKGSFNNHWGVPFTLLEEFEGAEITISEMGMNHAHELEILAKINEPDVVVCSVVGKEHIEHFGSLEKIAEANEEIYKFSPATAQRIYNLDNTFTAQMYLRASKEYPHSKRILTFSEKDSKADVFLQLKDLEMSGFRVQGRIASQEAEARVPVFGAHNLTNVMVAASLGLAGGLTPDQIWKALPLFKTNWGRNQLVQTKRGAEILFDGYNANPDSMKALIDNVKLLRNSGKKVGVFGQMLEMGPFAKDAHRELGEWAGQAGFDHLWFYGESAADFQAGAMAAGFKKNLMISDTYEDSLATELASVLDRGDIALVKGSRGMKLERFVLACHPVNFSLTKE